jgi:hypothetical protein
VITTIACFTSLLLTAPTEAQFDSGPRTRLLAPLLDEQTYLVAHLDLSRYDEAGIMKTLVPLLPRDIRSELEDALKAVKDFQTAFTKAGGSELIVLFDAEEMPNPSYVYIPLAEKANATALGKLLADTLPLGREVKVQKAGSMLVVGPAAALKRLDGRREPAAREGLADAIKAAGDTGAQVLLMPTKDQRRVLEEVVPHLPPQFGGIPSKHLTRGLRWAALGLDVSPKPAFRLTVQCADAAAAKTVNALLVAGVQALGRVKFTGEDKPFSELFPAEFLIAKALQPEVKEDRLIVAVSDPATLAAGLTRSEDLLARVLRAPDKDNLKQLGIAMHQYHNAHGSFPANALYSKDGKPLLSWRIALLPYLGHDNLYKQFKLDEPWDSEHNKKLVEQMPEVFRSPRLKRKEAGMTTYLAPLGESLIFTGTDKKIKISDIEDGTSNTILLVDAADDQAVVWTKPEDLKVDPNAPLKGLVGHYPGFFVAVFADGHVDTIPKNIAAKMLWALFTRNGGEVIAWPLE